MKTQALITSFSSKTLLGRFLLIFLLPIILLQVVNIYIFYQRHWDNVSEKMQTSLVEEVMVISNLIKTKNDFSEQITKLKPLQIQISLLDKMPDLKGKKSLYAKILEGAGNKDTISAAILRKGQDDKELNQLKHKLEKKLKQPFSIQYSNDSVYIIIDIMIHDSVLSLKFPSKRVQSATANIFIAWMIGVSIFLYTIAILFMKKQVQSITELADCADKLGKGHKIDFFNPSGAEEIRNAGEAIMMMGDRIERQINYRTELLAHISHDIRTPLTRMKLQVAMLKDIEAAKRLNKDVDVIENMVEGYLNFAKEEGNEEATNVNVVDMIQDIALSYKNDKIQFTSKTTTSHTISLRKYAMRRAITNLIDNALKHYKEKITIQFMKSNDDINIIVEDDGSGLDPTLYEEAFKPFFKANTESIGHGLGLTIVKSIVQSHGGKIELAKSSLGGLKVVISIPI